MYQNVWTSVESNFDFKVFSWNLDNTNPFGKSFLACEAVTQDILLFQRLHQCNENNCKLCDKNGEETINTQSIAEKLKQHLKLFCFDGENHTGLSHTVGVYWKTNLFELVHHDGLIFEKLGSDNADTGAVLALLSHKKSAQKFLFVSVHLSNRTATNSKQLHNLHMNEVMLLINAIKIMKLQFGPLHLVMGGGFNFAPREATFPYAETDLYNRIITTLGVQSAYKSVLGTESIFTNITLPIPECIDYIFYSIDGDATFRPVSVREYNLSSNMKTQGVCDPDPSSNSHVALSAFFTMSPPYQPPHPPTSSPTPLTDSTIDTKPSSSSSSSSLSSIANTIDSKSPPLPPLTTITSSSPHFHFLAIGDFGEPNKRLQIVASSLDIIAQRTNPSFVLTLGDNMYEDGCMSVNDPQFNTKWFQVFIRPFLSLQVPWKVCLGNHDYYGNPQSQIDYTKHPANYRGLWQCPSNNYNFKVNDLGQEDAGCANPLVEFFCIDTNASQKDVQFDHEHMWGNKYPNFVTDTKNAFTALTQQLQSSTARWKVVYGHHPIFTMGKGHNQEAQVLKVEFKFEDVLVNGGADVYLSGHEHVFQHHVSKGVHHFVGGASCRSHFYMGMNPDKSIKLDWYDDTYTGGFLSFDVTKESFCVQFIDAIAVVNQPSVLKEVIIDKKL